MLRIENQFLTRVVVVEKSLWFLSDLSSLVFEKQPVVGVCRSQTLDISNLLPNNAGLNKFQDSHGNFFKIFLIFVLRNSNTLYFNVVSFEEIVF